MKDDYMKNDAKFVSDVTRCVIELEGKYRKHNYTSLQIANDLREFDDFMISLFLTEALLSKDKLLITKIREAINIIEEEKSQKSEKKPDDARLTKHK